MHVHIDVQSVAFTPSMNSSASSPSQISSPSSPWDLVASSELVWYLDSGGSHHVTTNLANLASSQTYNAGEKLLVGNGNSLTIENISSNLFEAKTIPRKSLWLHNILHVPHIAKNKHSISKFSQDNSIFFKFHSSSCL